MAKKGSSKCGIGDSDQHTQHKRQAFPLLNFHLFSHNYQQLHHAKTYSSCSTAIGTGQIGHCNISTGRSKLQFFQVQNHDELLQCRLEPISGFALVVLVEMLEDVYDGFVCGDCASYTG